MSRGLEDILHKCLSLKPAARYPDAGQLAADLRFQLSNLPLRGVPNRSPLERWQKWRRRKPYAMPLLAIGLAAIVVVCGVCGLFYRDRVRMASSLLVESQQEFDHKEYDSSIEHAQTALSGLHWFSWQTELKEQLNAKITAAKRAQAVVALHDFVDRLRFLDNQPLSDPELKTLADQCDSVWEQHNQLAPATAKKTDDRQLVNADDSLRNDLLDLAILSARLDIQLSPPSKRIEAQRKARQKLNDAAELCGGSAILDLERRTDVPDAPAKAASSPNGDLPKVRTAWEHYAIGRWLMHRGSFAEAEQQFAAAIDQQPNEFWLNFQQTRCSFELQHFDKALISASVCIALDPQHAECFYNRAICHQSLNHADEALADFQRALQLHADFAPAALARGMLLVQLKRFTEAQADLESALKHSGRPSEVYYQMACLQAAQNNRASARDFLRKALAEEPNNSAARALQSQLGSGDP